VLAACRADGFGRVPSFRWLVSVLLALGQQACAHSAAAADLLMEVALRVPAVRRFTAESVHTKLLAAAGRDFADAPPPATLRAAAWILAEHGAVLPLDDRLAALRALLSAPAVSLPAEVQASFVQAALRVFAMLPFAGMEAPPGAGAEAANRGAPGAVPSPASGDSAAPSGPAAEAQLQPLLEELVEQARRAARTPRRRTHSVPLLVVGAPLLRE